MSSSTSASPPFILILIVQAISTIGDALGQRATRVIFNKSARRSLIIITLISCLQVFIILGIFQLVAPSTSGDIYKGSTKQSCYKEVDLQGHSPNYCSNSSVISRGGNTCTLINCPSQGPFSMFRTIKLHPLILVNGLQSVVYYISEVLLYGEAFGLVFIVMSAMASTLVIQPFQALFGIHDGGVNVYCMILGTVGAILCVIEWKKKKNNIEDISVMSSTSNQMNYYKEPLLENSLSLNTTDEEIINNSHQNNNNNNNNNNNRCKQCSLSSSLRIIIPFILLSAVYSTWFVTQRVFNEQYRTNMFGYTSIDQVLGPIYIYLTLYIIDNLSQCRESILLHEDKHQSFKEACIVSWKEATNNKYEGFIIVFFYRLLINGRAMAYFFLSVTYDLSVVYLDLQLTRIVLSWILTVILVYFFPKFIQISSEEKQNALRLSSILPKFIGSILVATALFILN